MARNVEIKARITSLEKIRGIVASMASDPPRVLRQFDTFFQVPEGRLKIRAFPDGSGELIAYHRSSEPGPRESAYTRCPSESADSLLEALQSVLPVRGTVSKRRELFLLGRTRVHLDEVEGLGAFLELEVVLEAEDSLEEGIAEAQELLELLQVGEEDLLADAYIDLLDPLHSG